MIKGISTKRKWYYNILNHAAINLRDYTMLRDHATELLKEMRDFHWSKYDIEDLEQCIKENTPERFLSRKLLHGVRVHVQ